MDINGNLHVLGESRTRRAVPDPALAPAVMDFMTENHLTAALPNSRLPNPATITVGWEVAQWCKTNGVIRYADNTIAYTVSTPGLVFARCLDTSSPTGYWQFWNVTELGANQAFDYRQSVLDQLNVPPGAPANGDRYIVGTAPVGLWAGQANSIAQWDAILMQWIFDVPAAGWLTLDLSAGPAFYYFDGLNWLPIPFGAGLINADNGLNVVGTTVKLGGPLLQNTNINGGLIYELDFISLKSFIAQSQDFFEIVLLGPSGPRITGDNISNRLSFTTNNSTGLAGEVAIADGLGKWIWGPVPSVPGLTSAINGLYTFISTVKLGGPLTENTTVTATGFQLRFGDNFAVLLGFGPQDIALSTTQGLWLNSDLPIHIRTNGSSGAITNLITHNGLGAVWDSLANIISTASPFTATYPLQWDTPLNIRVIPSATIWDVLTTNGVGAVVWSSFASNVNFVSTVNSLINTYINNPLFFSINTSFATNLNTYLNTQVNVFNVNILAPGNNQDILTTQGGVVTWVTPPMAVPLVSATNFITITAGPVTRTFNIFAQAPAANRFIMSTGVDAYSWVDGATLITTAMSATNVGIGGVGVAAGFVETYEGGSLANMRFRRIFAFNYGIELQYAGVNPAQSIIIKNGIAPALPPSGPGDKFLKWNFVTLLYEWSTGGGGACADNGLHIDFTSGCVHLGGTLLYATTVNCAQNSMAWMNASAYVIINGANRLAVVDMLAGHTGIADVSVFRLHYGITGPGVSGRNEWYYMDSAAPLGADGLGRAFMNIVQNDAKTGGAVTHKGVKIQSYNALSGEPFGAMCLQGYIFLDGGLVNCTTVAGGSFTESTSAISHRETDCYRAVDCVLPPDPIDGEWHIIYNKALVPITVTGAPMPVVLAMSKSALFRYYSGAWRVSMFT